MRSLVRGSQTGPERECGSGLPVERRIDWNTEQSYGSLRFVVVEQDTTFELTLLLSV